MKMFVKSIQHTFTFLMHIVFWNNFRFAEKLQRSYSCEFPQPISPLINILHFYSTFVKAEVLTLAQDRSLLIPCPDFIQVPCIRQVSPVCLVCEYFSGGGGGGFVF